MEKRKIVFTVLEILQIEGLQLLSKEANGHKVFALRDMTGVNAENIESEIFASLGEIMDRLDMYHRDYIYSRDSEKNKYERFLEDRTVKETLLGLTVEVFDAEVEAIAKGEEPEND